MQRWGKHPSGSRRYRCPLCGTNAVAKRSDLTLKSRQNLYLRWLVSKQTLTEYAQKQKVTRQTLDRWFKPFRNEEVTAQAIEAGDEVFILDGYYIQYAATILIGQTTANQVVSWLFTYAENYFTWSQFLAEITSFPIAVVCDGQRGLLKAIRERWPGIIIQRCQFHVIHHVNLLLTRHPETQAARDFKSLTNRMSRVKTEADLKVWLSDFRNWYQTYHQFLKEKTYRPWATPTGRRKWHYTHGHLHAAFAHVKNAIPNLFGYVRYPQIPNTSNRIEGGINAQIQRLIDRHRGTTLFQRRQIIAAYLRQKQSQKPTRNVT